MIERRFRKASAGPLRPLMVVVMALALVCGLAGGCAPHPAAVAPSPQAATTTSAQPSSPPSGSTPATRAPATVTPAPIGGPPIPGPSVNALLYFTRGGFVGVAGRAVSADRPAAEAVEHLVLGPTSKERAAGLGTAIPAGTRSRGVTIDGAGLATVDLTGRFAATGSEEALRLRVAQVVCTLTHFPTVRRVRILVDGRPVGRLGPVSLALPVTRADVEAALPAILVEAPVPHQQVTSPMRLSGSADVFEAQFVAELLLPDGTRIARRSVHATAGTGTRGVFSAAMSFPTSRGGTGTLVVYEPSAKDGSPTHVVKIPVAF